MINLVLSLLELRGEQTFRLLFGLCCGCATRHDTWLVVESVNSAWLNAAISATRGRRGGGEEKCFFFLLLLFNNAIKPNDYFRVVNGRFFLLFKSFILKGRIYTIDHGHVEHITTRLFPPPPPLWPFLSLLLVSWLNKRIPERERERERKRNKFVDVVRGVPVTLPCLLVDVSLRMEKKTSGRVRHPRTTVLPGVRRQK